MKSFLAQHSRAASHGRIAQIMDQIDDACRSALLRIHAINFKVGLIRIELLFPACGNIGNILSDGEASRLPIKICKLAIQHQYVQHQFRRYVLSNRTSTVHSDEIIAVKSRRLLPDPTLLRAIFLRRRKTFAVAFLAVLALTALVLALSPRVYSATSTLLLEPREQEPVKVNDRGFVAPADDNLIDTAVQALRSPTLALKVVRKLRLDELRDYGGSSDAEPVATTGAGKAQPEEIPGVDMTAAERRAMRGLLGHLGARRVGVTYLVEITSWGSDPATVARIANTVAQSYIELDAEQKQVRNNQSARYVEGQAAALRKQAVADDAALQDYMVRNNLMSAEGATMAEQEVSELNRQIADAQAKLAEQRGRLSAAEGQIARGSGGADTGAALASETIRQLRQQEAEASAKLAQLDARYGSRHPDVVEARDELADIRKQLVGELGRISSGLRAEVQVAQSRLDSLLASRGHAKGSLAQNGSAQVGRFELERRAEASRAIYNAYLTRAKETAQAGELPNADASISSAARAPDRPSAPNYIFGAFIGVLAALGTALLATAIAEYVEDTVATRNDIEDTLGVSYAGAIPSLQSASRASTGTMTPEEYVVVRPMSLFTESLRNLATHLDLVSAQGNHIVTVTSPLPREGKSTISMCLARTLAMGQRNVVLVDADVRHHSTSDALAPGREGEALFRVVDGTLALDDALTLDARSGLWVLPTLGPQRPDDVLTEEGVARLLATLRERFEVVVIDSAPLLGVAETRIMTRLSDTTVMVARWRQTPLKALRTALDLLAQSDSKLGGVALSVVNIKEYASAGLTDAFGYYKKFAGYYVD